MLTAKDIMTPEVITVNENATVRELATLLLMNSISGAPVVNEAGELVGVVSQTDIVRHLEEVAATFTGQFFLTPARLFSDEARHRVRCGRSGRLGVPLSQVASHDERDESRVAEHDRREARQLG